MKSIPFEDLINMSEPDRIKRIALELCFGKMVGFFVDAENADRYISLLKKELPGATVHAKTPGPNGTVLVRISGARG